MLIAPGCLDRIQYASGNHCSIRGKIQSEMKLEGRSYQLRVTIPPNTQGRVKLPIISDRAVIKEGEFRSAMIMCESVVDHMQ
ncbi:alpha-L-rhamnosidase C-terminal domain-containing protein [Paenibacillus illinoisensis]|uniref:alpha-L-rhamnosidase C-terminal domain-containing protein n=1 Tax=Paenibacillus illinoisensis TaxID=59845 RepID=UPI003D2CEC61